MIDLSARNAQANHFSKDSIDTSEALGLQPESMSSFIYQRCVKAMVKSAV